MKFKMRYFAYCLHGVFCYTFWVCPYLKVLRYHVRSDGVLGDFCDGEMCRTNPYLEQHPDALQLVGYYDEIEVCNPLGSHSGVHKLGESQ